VVACVRIGAAREEARKEVVTGPGEMRGQPNVEIVFEVEVVTLVKSADEEDGCEQGECGHEEREALRMHIHRGSRKTNLFVFIYYINWLVPLE
jgi:hypothetical protein